MMPTPESHRAEVARLETELVAEVRAHDDRHPLLQKLAELNARVAALEAQIHPAATDPEITRHELILREFLRGERGLTEILAAHGLNHSNSQTIKALALLTGRGPAYRAAVRRSHQRGAAKRMGQGAA